MRYADMILVAFVVAIAAMLIVPLPTPLLDVLLVLNISFAILLLLVGLYVPNSAALYTFPTVLLLSTLFRLGLNVASSRLILSQGDAGRVIESFGTFLIRGEVVVGIIIFSIVTIVNFIVISKGASRVSEVAARFALDSLPGKQLAIDNDARAGLISAEEARLKRDDLRRESQLYGSMDGAMKFVQGDAVAGFFIIAANILGGVYMGVTSGMELSDAVQAYTVLTVGDGLVTQIPGLLTSICAGIVVTRVSSTETATLSSDLRQQLFSQPAILVATGVILLLFAVLPDIPAIPFLTVSFGAIAAGIVMARRRSGSGALALGGNEFGRSAGLPAPGHTGGVDELDDQALTIKLDSAVLFRSYKSNGGSYMGWWQSFRSEFANDVGILLPEVRIASDDLSAPSSFSVFNGGVEMFAGSVIPDALLVEISSSQAAILGLEVLQEEEHPISGHRVFWALHTPALRRMLDAGAIRGFDFFEYVALRVAGFCLRHPEEFIGVTDVHSLLRQVDKRHPGLINEGFGKSFVSVPKLAEILQELVRQGIAIRDFRGVIESVASYCSSSGVTVDDDTSLDVTEAVSYVRGARRRQILRRFIGSGRSLRAISLSADVEQVLADSELESRALPPAMDAESFRALATGLQHILKPAFDLGTAPVAVLCPPELRQKCEAFTRAVTRPLFVVAVGELEPAISVEQVSTWDLAYR
jgi:type III secretory pathway component EscV